MSTATTGEVTEWPNVPVSKTGVGATSPRVRIPPSPYFLTTKTSQTYRRDRLVKNESGSFYAFNTDLSDFSSIIYPIFAPDLSDKSLGSGNRITIITFGRKGRNGDTGSVGTVPA
jgi:hypothetical protein